MRPRERDLVYWTCVGGNLAALGANVCSLGWTLWRGDSVLLATAGMGIASLGVWAIVASRGYLDALHHRLTAEIEMAERTRDVMRNATSLAIGIEKEEGDDGRRH